MVKASALYIVIVIALVMAVICSSLIVAAYFYKIQYQQTFRYQQLSQNLNSGVNILLESKMDLTTQKKISLFQTTNDTVLIQRHPWGIFELGIVQSFIQHDTLSKVFTMAHKIDSVNWATLYIIDEDRNISVSGKTSIKGTAYIPKAGIKEAYVNNQAYQGDKKLINGVQKTSGKTLPVLNTKYLALLVSAFKAPDRLNDSSLLKSDSVRQSFLKPALRFNFLKKPYTCTNQLEGHVILYSDTSIEIASSAKLRNIMVFAKSITVKSGFRGNCQLFATDSIHVESGCYFTYPSAIAVLNMDEITQGQRKLTLGDQTHVEGAVICYEVSKNELRPVIDLGKKVTVNGQIYVQGLLNYKDGLEVKGAVYTDRFLYQTAYTRYENYLINIQLNGPALSRYYLTSSLLPAFKPANQILQWLE